LTGRVAVIGAGISGLVAARELQRAGFDLTVFEAGDAPGGHSATVRVSDDAGAWGVDTGFVVFNDRNYPNFERLLRELGVASQPAPMAFGVSDERGEFEWSMRPLGLFANHAHLFDPRFHRMLLDLVRFFREARQLVGMNGSGGSLRSFLESRGYSEYFVERMIVPQASAVWSADPSRMWSFPASFLAEFFDHHGALQFLGRPRWRSIRGGASRYVEALTAPFADRIRVSTAVRKVRRLGDRVEVRWAGGVDHFDEIVFAVHSDQALAMLGDPTVAEREILGAIPYQSNDVVLHTDESVMPRRRRAWGSWNFHLSDAPRGRPAITYDMNRLQGLDADRRFLVTLNRSDAIDRNKVVHSTAYAHPIYTVEGVRAQERWEEISGRNRTHYCGAYWGWGFHEDGVVSALRACELLGAIERGRSVKATAVRPVAA
jgi:uncharacterized protein